MATTLALTIGGMNCQHCVMRVNKALTALPGVTVDEVAVGSARVTYDEAAVDAARIAATVTALGFPAAPRD